MFSSHWTTLTVRKFKHFAVQNSVWTKPKSWTVPCERSVRSNISARRKFVRWRVNRYTLGDMSLQHFAAINHSVCTGRAISCATSPSDKSLGAYSVWWIHVQIFVSATEFCRLNKSHKFSLIFYFLRLVALTKFCCGDKDFDKNSPVYKERFVAATCRRNVLQELVAWCVPTLTTINEK